MNSKFFTARNVALLGILIALVIVLQLFASGIPMFGVTLNFSLIPIALASILLGWFGGAIVGFACGMVTFITMAILGQDILTAYMFQTSPVLLTIMCVGKTTIAGAVAGLVFKAISKKNLFIAVCVCALIIPVMNTAIYLIGIALMKDAVIIRFGLAMSSASAVVGFIFGLIWLNFLIEVALNVVFIPMIHRVIKVISKVR